MTDYLDKSEKELKHLIKKMMQESIKKNNLYLPGNYWKFYEKNIIKQIESKNLSKFRSWEAGIGTGNIKSFGGGSELRGRLYKKNYHPIDTAFNFIDDSVLIRKYNSLINKIIPYFPLMKYFLIRMAEMKIYYKGIYKKNLIERYNLIKNLDESLIKASDSSFGLDKEDIIHIDNKVYTNHFLNELLQINFIKKNTEFDSIKYVIELGAGIGMLASTFLKLNNRIKYVISDIAPQIFFSEYFLRNIGYKVYGYEDVIREENIDLNKIFNDFDVVCIPTWKLDNLDDFNFDLFINVASFQEMEKEQALNYLSILKKKISKYIFSSNLIEGHQKTEDKNSFGVLRPVTLKIIEDDLQNDFLIKKRFLNDGYYKAIFEKK